LAKLDLIISAHPEVFKALDNFLSHKNKKLVYILGNHDAELVFKTSQAAFINKFDEKNRDRIFFNDSLYHFFCCCWHLTSRANGLLCLPHLSLLPFWKNPFFP